MIVKRWISVLIACAATTLGSAAFAAGVPVAQATEDDTERARTAYVDAKKAYDARDFEQALIGFRASYDVVASPNSHLMVAKCLRSLGRHADAYKEVKLAVPEADAAAAVNKKYERTAKDARALLNELRGLVGFVTVRINPSLSGDLTINGEVVDVASLDEPLVVDPGEITAVLTGEHGSTQRSTSIGAGGTALIELAPDNAVSMTDVAEETPDDGGDGLGVPMTIGIVAAGVGVTGMVLFGVFGSMTSSKFSDLETACPNGACPAEVADDIDSGETFQIVANTSLIIGVTGLIAGTALILIPVVDGAGGDDVALHVGPGSLLVTGSF